MVDEPERPHAYHFFLELVGLSQKVVAALPITREPPAMSYITGVIRPAAEALALEHRFTEPPEALVSERFAAIAKKEGRSPSATGLNTIGMLLDRISILIVKHWNLVNRAQDLDKAETLLRTQIEDIVRALADAEPGYSSINNKMTKLPFGRGQAGSFSEMYQGLLLTNCLLWEAQEVLYNHDIAALPDSELRDYINFFSKENLRRNGFIQGVEQAYWTATQGLHAVFR